MTNQVIVKMALDAWNARMEDAHKLLAHLTDAQLQNEIAPGKNRGIYLLGHLTAVHDRMLPLLNLGDQLYPQLNTPFLANPDKATEEIPTADNLRKYWARTAEVLTQHFNSMQAEQWLEQHTSVTPEDFIKEPHRNKLNIVISRTNHLAYHLGQLSLLKN